MTETTSPSGGADTLAPERPQVAPQDTGFIAREDDTSIRPFQYRASDEDLADLRQRLQATRWPERELVDDATQGVQLATLQKLADYWLTSHDWRKAEARINSYPNFLTNIDGLDIHFIHVKSKHPNALPLIITHGWPGSVIEQLKVIEPLTDPTSFGGKAEDAFDVVVPSLPGYGFSAKPSAPGWGPERIARAWDVLMKRLGYTQYVAQGGDWGSMISDFLGVQAPEGLLAIHNSMAAAVPVEVDKAAFTGVPPSDLAEDEKLAFEHLADFYKNGLAYAQEMGNRPQTLYGVADSPVALAGWIIDHDIRSYLMIARVFDGAAEGLTRDDIVDNITLYWLTNTGVSSGRIYWENKYGFVTPKGVKVPTAVSVFPEDIYMVSKRWAEQAYPKLIHYNLLPKGGHFAAWEQPEVFTKELRDSFRSLRN